MSICTVVVSLLLLLLITTVTGSATYPDHRHHKKQTTKPVNTTSATRKCYQCSYSPGKTVYKEEAVERTILDRASGKYRTVMEKTMVPQQQIGGWDKCGGTFSTHDAAVFGIDTWDCQHNCAVRVDRAGNLFRGCYRGEFGVDPNNVKNVQQVGNSRYRFCGDDLCNRFSMSFH